jgi:hypothetical protein
MDGTSQRGVSFVPLNFPPTNRCIRCEGPLTVRLQSRPVFAYGLDSIVGNCRLATKGCDRCRLTFKLQTYMGGDDPGDEERLYPGPASGNASHFRVSDETVLSTHLLTHIKYEIVFNQASFMGYAEALGATLHGLFHSESGAGTAGVGGGGCGGQAHGVVGGAAALRRSACGRPSVCASALVFFSYMPMGRRC